MCWILIWLGLCINSPVSLTKEFTAMGTAFEVTVVADEMGDAEQMIDAAIAEVDRIEKLISSWDLKSQTSAVNQNAGINPVEVDAELFFLVERSLQVSKLTQGAFDISYASMDRIWEFSRSEIEPPSKEAIAASVAKIGYTKIELNPNRRSIYLPEKGMKIGFGAIGKGYAAMKVSKLLKDRGALGGIVNAGGDLYAWGRSHRPEGWRVAVADPKKKNEIMAYLTLQNQAVVTSGDYERYTVIDGQRYAHIIDPRTGWPTTGLKSVTVVCHDAELADALATAIFVLGKENGLYLINQLKGVECLLVDDEDELITSNNLKLNYEKHVE